MKAVFTLALRNLVHSPKRSLFLLAFLCAAFLSITLIRAGYADMFERVRKSVIRSQGDLFFSASDSRGMDLAAYLALKDKLLSDGRISEVKAMADVQGLAGTEETSAPVSGYAIEDFLGGPAEVDGSVGVDLGASLAASLGLKPGDSFSGYVNDSGFDFRLQEAVRTEAVALDRFYIKMPFEALTERDGGARVSRVLVWFSAGGGDPLGLIREISASPELAGYKSSAYELGNTNANSVVAIYEDSFRVVLLVVAATMLLALSNAMLLSSWERGQEWGTMLAIGSPFASVGAVILLESVLLALAAALAGGVLTLSISIIANAAGGIRLPPPPTATEPMLIGLKPEWSSFAVALLLSLACGFGASAIAVRAVRRGTIVELLYERN